MPLSRSSTLVAVSVAALTMLGSATSAFADRNMYTRSGYGHGYGYHRHMNPFRFHHHHMMGGYRSMHRHGY